MNGLKRHRGLACDGIRRGKMYKFVCQRDDYLVVINGPKNILNVSSDAVHKREHAKKTFSVADYVG